MARGRKGGIKSLAETVDEKDIVDLKEELNAPNILIDDEYGICENTLDYALVHKTIRYRTGTEEDGINNGKVLRYVSWEYVNYAGSVMGILKNYFKVVELSSVSKLTKANIKEVAIIHKQIQETIDKAIENMGLSKNEQYSLNLVDQINDMKSKLKRVDYVLKEADDLYDLIKEKRKIIVDNTKNIK